MNTSPGLSLPNLRHTGLQYIDKRFNFSSRSAYYDTSEVSSVALSSSAGWSFLFWAHFAHVIHANLQWYHYVISLWSPEQANEWHLSSDYWIDNDAAFRMYSKASWIHTQHKQQFLFFFASVLQPCRGSCPSVCMSDYPFHFERTSTARRFIQIRGCSYWFNFGRSKVKTNVTSQIFWPQYTTNYDTF